MPMGVDNGDTVVFSDENGLIPSIPATVIERKGRYLPFCEVATAIARGWVSNPSIDFLITYLKNPMRAVIML